VPHIPGAFLTARTEGKGLGLGLSTIFGIVGRPQGTIEVRSAAGQGSTFNIRLSAGNKGKG
jgi:C4-dicarboxylate-specific signal transduction histidine kinase